MLVNYNKVKEITQKKKDEKAADLSLEKIQKLLKQ